MNKLFTFDKTIDAGENFYLKDIISDTDYKEWFSMSDNPKIFILNKGRCGNGGTTGFINYAKKHNKGIYIMVPNVSIAMSKEFDDEICCVYGGATGTDENKPVKVATWDSGLNIIKYYQEWGLAGEDVFDNKTWKNSLLVIDEYHKIVEDSSFRCVCAKILENVIKTKLNVVMMSATPDYELIEMLREVSGKEVITINVEYPDLKEPCIPVYTMFDYRKKDKEGKIIDKNTIKNIIHSVIDANKEKQICVFHNNVKELNDIIDQSIYKDDIELLCSKNNENDVENWSNGFDKNKHIHFLTSAYFTGMDINTFIDIVIIIGGVGSAATALTNKSIKQITGRMRQGYGDLYVINDSTRFNMEEYGINSTEKEEAKKYWERLSVTGDIENWVLKHWLDYSYLSQSLIAMDAWQTFDKFKKYMSVFTEYSVKKDTMSLIEKKPYTRKTATFNEYKMKRLNNEKIEYLHSYMCEKYIEVKGIEKFKIATRNDIKRWYENWKSSGGKDVNEFSQDELWKIFLGNGIYPETYLRSLLEYIKINQTDYLAADIEQAFNCNCGWFEGKTTEQRKNYYMTIRLDRGIFGPKSGNKTSASYIEKFPSFGPKYPCFGPKYPYITLDGPVSTSTTLKVSKRYSIIEVEKNQWSRTKSHSITTDLFTTDITSLDEIKPGLANFILNSCDKIKDVKQINTAKNDFDKYKNSQTMISEFYKSNCNNRYRHTKDECDTISSVMVDIDNSIDFNEFKEYYKDVHFIAYPSMSNTDSVNWNKYRVIFPLEKPVNIPEGNYNLQVVKFLRNFVCKWEDQQHNLGSYINKEQWDIRYTNDGHCVNITQDLVDYINTLIYSIREYKELRMNKDGKFKGGNWTVDESIAEWEKVENKFKGKDSDGERHTTTFKIKANLSEENRKLFREWLKKNYPNAIKHYDSHNI